MRALSKGVNKGRCFAMKMIYEAPAMYAEAFAPNQYVAACKDPDYQVEVDPLNVRCQTKGHQNTAIESIFFGGNENCDNAYDMTADGAGIVEGVWDNGFTHPTFGIGTSWVEWFYEDTNKDGVITTADDTNQSDWVVKNRPFYNVKNMLVKAFKGFFQQDGDTHLFYAKINSISQYNLS